MPDGMSLRCICTAAVEVGNARAVATRNALWRQRAGRRSGAATAVVKAAVAMGTLEGDEMRWLAQEKGAAAKVCKSNVPRLAGGLTWKHIWRLRPNNRGGTQKAKIRKQRERASGQIACMEEGGWDAIGS